MDAGLLDKRGSLNTGALPLTMGEKATLQVPDTHKNSNIRKCITSMYATPFPI